MITAEEFKKIELEREKVRKEQLRRKELETGIAQQVSEEAFKNFPEIKHLSLEKFIKFSELIGIAAHDLAARIINFTFKR
jgi:hypothetical protein